ncbi:MAG: hypothetical protein FP816_08730 [Desulfobacteraceae bacterium]|nr:hypothetical protein [Desulfobacteraceae bacterium]
MDERKLALFLADFDHQIFQVEKIYGLLEDRANSLNSDHISSETVDSIGYWLHNLFSAFEDLFKIVAAFWENSVGKDGNYHKSLISRMVLNIEGVRPALISEKTFSHLDELRGFRHVFRHAYSYGLDDERVLYLLRKILKEKALVLKEHQSFREKIIGALK